MGAFAGAGAGSGVTKKGTAKFGFHVNLEEVALLDAWAKAIDEKRAIGEGEELPSAFTKFNKMVSRLKDIFLSNLLKYWKNIKQSFFFKREQIKFFNDIEMIKIA